MISSLINDNRTVPDEKRRVQRPQRRSIGDTPKTLGLRHSSQTLCRTTPSLNQQTELGLMPHYHNKAEQRHVLDHLCQTLIYCARGPATWRKRRYRWRYRVSLTWSVSFASILDIATRFAWSRIAFLVFPAVPSLVDLIKFMVLRCGFSTIKVPLGDFAPSLVALLVWSVQWHSHMADSLSSLCKIAINQANVFPPVSIVMKSALGGELASETHHPSVVTEVTTA